MLRATPDLQAAELFQHLDERTRPAMRDHERKRPTSRAPYMNKVDVQPVDLGGELTELVNRVFLRPPIELCLPIVDDFPHVFDTRTVGPRSIRACIRPTRSSESRFEVGKRRLRDVYAEWAHSHSIFEGNDPSL
jgi:hypothetical protein